MKIRFFEENEFLTKKAIGPGVYLFKIGKSGGSDSEFKPLYVGESYSMTVRCGTHLYELYKEPSYFGLKDEDLLNNNLELKVEIYESVDIDKKLNNGDRDIVLHEKELNAINKLKPLSQLETSDRLNKQRMEIVQNFLKEFIKNDIK